MRIMFLALLIVLLPLRGMMGDAMAMAMMSTSLPPAHHATKSIAGSADMVTHDAGFGVHSGASMLVDCAGHAGPGDTPWDLPQPDDGDCSVCAACQICHSVALAPVFPQLAATRLTAAQPQMTPRHYASAEGAPGFKPPIS